ncbi:MAG: FRG domain-containing protein [Planctomycetota bacterium]
MGSDLVFAHHGCPTRLLDWTESPETAAFFAAEHAEEGSRELAVWALNLRYLALNNIPIRPFAVPRSTIGYLHAQEGLFTYAENADLHFSTSGEWPSVEKLCSSALIKLTLPWSEANELRRLLYAEGVNRAALMPTYDNVVKMLKSHQAEWHGHH